MKVETRPLFEALDAGLLPGLDRNIFCSRPWFNVIRTAYRPRMFVKLIETWGTVRSFVVYTVVHNFLEEKICVLSYCDYCDSLIGDPGDWSLFFESFRRDFPRYRIALRTLRDTAARTCGHFRELSREYFHLLDLTPDLDTLWKGLDGSFRNQVRQGERRGLVCREGTLKDLFDFYLIHVGLRRSKYRIFAQPYRFFRAIWDEFVVPGNGFLLCGFSPEGRMVGGSLYLVHGDSIYYKVNTSSPEASEFRCNNVLKWEAIRRARERGLRAMDLGSSGHDQTGLVHFKDGTGARRQDIVHMGYHPPGYVFSQKRILKIYTRAMTAPWVPTLVTRMGSHLMYPYLA